MEKNRIKRALHSLIDRMDYKLQRKVYATALPARVRRQRGDIKTFYFFLKVPSSTLLEKKRQFLL